jgi:hypothetical protein
MSPKSSRGGKATKPGGGCARFPESIASHSRERDFSSGGDFVRRRHVYHVDVTGAFPAAHYMSDIGEIDGIRFPTKRRASVRGPDFRPIRNLLRVSIDLSEFRFAQK